MKISLTVDRLRFDVDLENFQIRLGDEVITGKDIADALGEIAQDAIKEKAARDKVKAEKIDQKPKAESKPDQKAQSKIQSPFGDVEAAADGWNKIKEQAQDLKQKTQFGDLSSIFKDAFTDDDPWSDFVTALEKDLEKKEQQPRKFEKFEIHKVDGSVYSVDSVVKMSQVVPNPFDTESDQYFIDGVKVANRDLFIIELFKFCTEKK